MMEVLKTVFMWIGTNLFDILLVIVGASAVAIYLHQKINERRVAATLILEQMDSVEKSIANLKEAYEHDTKKLDDNTVYLSSEIACSGAWNQYRYLMLNKLTQAEYTLIQCFFDRAYQIEKTRGDIIYSFKLAWNHKSFVTEEMCGKFHDPSQKFETSNRENLLEGFLKANSVTPFFRPDIAYRALYAELENYEKVSGTTAYSKLESISYRKK